MNLLSVKFWFAVGPAPLRSASLQLLLILFFIFLLAGVGAKIVAHYKRNDFSVSRIARRASRPLLSTGFIGFLLLFFEYQRAPFLSSRFWYAVLLLWFIYSTVRFLQYVSRMLPQELHAYKEKIRKEKYLP